jgi:hypothetical protein
MQQYPFNFGGTFLTLVIKAGSSEIPHLDSLDGVKGYAYLLTFREYTGGDLALPQLGLKVPLVPGQLLMFNARLLAHLHNIQAYTTH